MYSPLSSSRTYSGDLRPGHIVGHDFEVQAMAGRGSFSTVYKATQRSQNNRPVALKLLHWGIQQKLTQRNPDATNPFLREKAIVSRLSHPAVCSTYRTGRSEEGRWVT